MKRMTKGAPMGTPKELETLVWRQEEGRCRAIAGKKYREHFLEALGAADLSARYPGLNTGWRQVLRIICGHYWTGKRLADAKMAREELKGQCPCCTIDEPESVLHIVWECNVQPGTKTEQKQTPQPVSRGSRGKAGQWRESTSC
ncbi:MAG: uncharacterized protein A8A55_2780 [Amphiamblys sp. WSBS2006]|nr:MAG: uncharacterized protein A8A55_2780 [Amphiamblys sp. WSBS2006]